MTDGLRKWFVFVSRFMVMFFLSGSVKIGGVFFNSALSVNMSGAMAGFIFMLPYTVGRLCGPLTSALLEFSDYGCLGVIGGILVGSGYFLTGLLDPSPALHVVLAILSGFGFGCVLVPVTLCMRDHFEDSFPVWMPLSMMGSYAGITVLPPLMELSRRTYGDKAAYILFGALCWNLIPCGLFMRKPTHSQRQKVSDIVEMGVEGEGRNNDTPERSQLGPVRELACRPQSNERKSGTISWLQKDSVVDEDHIQRLLKEIKKNLTLFTDVTFLLLFFVANVRKIPNDGWTLYLIPHTIEMGLDSLQATQVASIGGLAGILGRILASLSFMVPFSPILIYALYLFLNGMIFILMEALKSEEPSLLSQSVGSAMNGALLSTTSGMTSGILHSIQDLTTFGTACGVLDFGSGLISLLAGVLPGAIRDRAGDLTRAFYLFGIISSLNGVLTITLWCRTSTKQKAERHT